MNTERRTARGRASVVAIAALVVAGFLTSGRSAAESFDLFDSYLAAAYREVWAIAARNGGGERLAEDFLDRAALAAAGHPVVPLAIRDSEVNPWTAHEASVARVQLLSRLDAGARLRQPLLAAIAQVNFDCWVSPLPERLGVPDSDECRRRFYFAFAGLRSAPPPPSRPATEAISARMAAAPAERVEQARGCFGALVQDQCLQVAFVGAKADRLIGALRAGGDAIAFQPIAVNPLMSSPSASAVSPPGSAPLGAVGAETAPAGVTGNPSDDPGGQGPRGAGSIKDMAGNGNNSASPGSNGIGGAVSSGANTAGAAVSSAGNAVGGAISTAGNAAGTAVSSAGNAAGAAISGAGGAAGTAVSSAGSATAGGAISSAGSAAGAAVSSAGNAAGGAISSGSNTAGAAVSSAANAAGGAISSAGSAAGAAAGGAANAVGNAVGGVGRAAGGALGAKGSAGGLHF